MSKKVLFGIVLFLIFLTPVYASLTDGLVSYYTLNEVAGSVAADSLGINNGTINGTTPVAGKVSYARNFTGPGTSNRIETGVSQMNIGPEFTFNAWVSIKNITSYNTIFSKWGSGGAAHQSFIFRVDNGKLLGDVRGNLGTEKRFSANTTLAPSTWYMATFVKTPTGIYLYLNGTLDNSTTFTENITVTDQINMIGAYQEDLAVNDFEGLIDELGVWNRSLTSAEITELYDNNVGLSYPFIKYLGVFNISLITPENNSITTPTSFISTTISDNTNITNVSASTLYIWNQSQYNMQTNTTGLVAWYKFDDGTANDTMGLYNGTVSGATYTTQGKIGGAYSFDGTDDYVNCSNSSVFNILDTTGITLSAWVKVPIGSGANLGVVAKKVGTTGYDFILNNGKPRLSLRGTSTLDSTALGSDLRDGSWHLITGVGNSTNASVYINGVYVGSNSGNWTAVPISTPLAIGIRNIDEMNLPFNGSIDDVRIYNRTLSATEIANLYNIEKIDKQPNGLVGWWKLDNNTLDSSGFGNTGTVNNSINTTGKIGNAMFFDGDNDFIVTASMGLSVNESYSLSAWIKIAGPNKPGQAVMTIVGSSDTTRAEFDVLSGSNRLSIWGRNAANTGYYGLTSDVNLLNNVWYHVIGLYNSADDKYYLYINGNLDKSATATGHMATAGNLAIGTMDTGDGETYQRDFNGSIDNVKFFKRALNQSEISAMYAAENQNYTGTNIWDYNFTEAGNKYWGVWSENTTQTYGNWSSIYNLLVVTNVTPVINVTNAFNNSVFFGKNITGQFNFSDDYLYRWNISLDGVTLANATNVNYTSYSYNLSINSTTLSPGKHTITTIVSDSHTANKIGNYSVKYPFLSKKSITYYYNNDKKWVKVGSDENSGVFSTEKLEDRYVIEYTPDKVNDKYYSFVVSSSDYIDIINKPNSDIKQWVVTNDKWVDFYTPEEKDAKVEIIRIDNKSVEFKVFDIKNSDKIKFNSIGDLNIVTQNYTFYALNVTNTYSSSAYEYENVDFVFTINLGDSPVDINNFTGALTWNGTNVSSAKTSNATAVIFTASKTLPSVPSPGKNVSFTWQMTYNSETPVNYTENQTIKYIGIGPCSSNPTWVEALTIYNYDEENNSLVNNVTLNMHIRLIGNTTGTKDFGFEFRNNSTYHLCIDSPTQEYTVYMQIEYEAVGYAHRNYYIDEYTLTNETGVLNLYLIDTLKYSDIVVIVYDSTTGGLIENATIKALRYFPESDNGTTAAYKTVEVEKTDITGRGVMKLVLVDVWYKFIVEYPVGTVVEETDIQKIIDTTKYFPITLSTSGLLDYNSLLAISGDVSCTVSTQTCRFTWSNPTGVDLTGQLRVYQDTGYSKSLIYSAKTTSSAATIAYVIPGNITNKAYTAEGWLLG